jgi:transcriptional regulator with XRE-family HTH domain
VPNDDDDYDVFAMRLKRLRRQRHLSQDQLTEKSLVGKTLIQRYEKGEHLPKDENVEALAGALGVSPKDLDPRLKRPDQGLRMTTLPRAVVRAHPELHALLGWLTRMHATMFVVMRHGRSARMHLVAPTAPLGRAARPGRPRTQGGKG